MALILRDPDDSDRRLRHGAYFDGSITLCRLYVGDVDAAYQHGLLETARQPMNCQRCLDVLHGAL